MISFMDPSNFIFVSLYMFIITHGVFLYKAEIFKCIYICIFNDQMTQHLLQSYADHFKIVTLIGCL